MFDGISTLTYLRLILVIAGGGLFLYGVSIDSSALRLAAVGVLTVSFLLRFGRRRR